jgi:hypothetical protein
MRAISADDRLVPDPQPVLSNDQSLSIDLDTSFVLALLDFNENGLVEHFLHFLKSCLNCNLSVQHVLLRALLIVINVKMEASAELHSDMQFFFEIYVCEMIEVDYEAAASLVLRVNVQLSHHCSAVSLFILFDAADGVDCFFVDAQCLDGVLRV